MTVKELKRRMDAGEDLFILDVREPYEYQIANIGGKLIPQNEVPQRLAEIDRDREIMVQCRIGARSQRIAEFLSQPATQGCEPCGRHPGLGRRNRPEDAKILTATFRSVERKQRAKPDAVRQIRTARTARQRAHLDALVAASAVDPSLYQLESRSAGQGPGRALH